MHVLEIVFLMLREQVSTGCVVVPWQRILPFGVLCVQRELEKWYLSGPTICCYPVVLSMDYAHLSTNSSVLDWWLHCVVVYRVAIRRCHDSAEVRKLTSDKRSRQSQPHGHPPCQLHTPANSLSFHQNYCLWAFVGFRCQRQEMRAVFGILFGDL